MDDDAKNSHEQKALFSCLESECLVCREDVCHAVCSDNQNDEEAFGHIFPGPYSCSQCGPCWRCVPPVKACPSLMNHPTSVSFGKPHYSSNPAVQAGVSETKIFYEAFSPSWSR